MKFFPREIDESLASRAPARERVAIQQEEDKWKSDRGGLRQHRGRARRNADIEPARMLRFLIAKITQNRKKEKKAHVK